jgi:hypothetical protein
MRLPLRPEITKEIEAMVALYTPLRTDFAGVAKRVEADLIDHDPLRLHIHSTKKREKDPDHLRNKLKLKAYKALADRKPFPINELVPIFKPLNTENKL